MKHDNSCHVYGVRFILSKFRICHEEEQPVKEIEVRVVRLEPMRVASAHAFSATPENDAREKLITWAKRKGLLDDPVKYRVFGFDNPSPSPGSPNYGYEFWITVVKDVQAEGEIKIKEFSGGLYAVTRCEVRSEADAYEVIPGTWKQLEVWREKTGHKAGSHQWLEEHIGTFKSSNAFTLDLYRPIAE